MPCDLSLTKRCDLRPESASTAVPTSLLNFGSSKFSTSPLATWMIRFAHLAILELFVKSSYRRELNKITEPLGLDINRIMSLSN